MDLREISTLGFIREFKEVTSGMHPRKFCFVLGAGASISSGIPSGQKLVTIWDAELRDRNAEEHERWKEKLGITDANRAEFYSQYYEARFPISMDGYAYMENIMEQASPGAGYAALAHILCQTDNNIVLTTNFDRLAEDAINRHQHKYPLVIGHEALAHYIVDDAKRPIVIKIHRDLLMDPKSKAKEIDHLDDRWEEHLEKVFSNYHPIFIGYAGNDQSLMDYLIKNSGKVKDGTWKLPYWTLYGKEPLSGKAREFMEAAGGYVIRNCDFDELLIRLGDARDYRLKPEEEAVKEAREENAGIRKKINEVLEKTLKPELPDKPKGTASAETPEEPGKAGASEVDAANAEEAAKELNEAVGRITGDVDSADRWERRRQAIRAYNRGDYEEATRLMRQLVEADPENARYHYNLGATLHAMERYEEAEAEKRRAVELEPENARYHNSLGVTLQKLKRHEEDEAETRHAVELEPENAKYHHEHGVTLRAMKRYEEAEAENRRAVELEPENAKYHRGLGVTLRELKRYDEALAEINRAIELQPETPIHYGSLSLLYQAMGKPEEAERAEAKEKALEAKQAGTGAAGEAERT